MFLTLTDNEGLNIGMHPFNYLKIAGVAFGCIYLAYFLTENRLCTKKRPTESNYSFKQSFVARLQDSKGKWKVHSTTLWCGWIRSDTRLWYEDFLCDPIKTVGNPSIKEISHMLYIKTWKKSSNMSFKALFIQCSINEFRGSPRIHKSNASTKPQVSWSWEATLIVHWGDFSS